MSNLLLPKAIAAPPPRPPAPPRPSEERMLTQDELAQELDLISPAYQRFLGPRRHPDQFDDRLFTAVEVDLCDANHTVFGTGRLVPEAKFLPVVSDAKLRLQVVAKTVLSDLNRFEMRYWVSETGCGTAHCIAGWAVKLGGSAVELFAARFGYELTGLALLGHEAAPRFYDTNELALSFLKGVER